MDKYLPCTARDVGSIPDWGTKITHAADQLSLHAAAIDFTSTGAHAP